MVDDKLWLLMGGFWEGEEFGAQEIVSTFYAEDMGEALQRSRALIDPFSGGECDIYQLVRVGLAKDNDFHAMWSWWKEDGKWTDDRGDNFKSSATSEQEGR